MADLSITIQEGLGNEELNDIKRSLEETGLNVEIHKRDQSGPFASLDWIIPTGFALVLLKPYYETLLKKAAEDHYEILKGITKRLYKKAIHPENEYKIVSMNGTEKETIFTMHFSVLHEMSKDNRKIHLKLMFPKNCSSEYFERSISEFSKLQSELMEKEQADRLFDKLVDADKGRYGAKIFWYNDAKEKLEFLDLIESSKNKDIVAKDIA